MSAEHLYADAKNGFPFWVLSTACSEPQAYEDGRAVHESSLDPYVIRRYSRKMLGLTRKDAARTYRSAFGLGASVGYPRQFHSICFMAGRELESFGVRLGFYSGNAACRMYDVGIDSLLMAANGIRPFPPVKISGREPSKRLSPNLGYSDEFLLDDPLSVIRIANSFEGSLVKAIGRVSVDAVSSKVREWSALPAHELYKLSKDAFNGL